MFELNLSGIHSAPAVFYCQPVMGAILEYVTTSEADKGRSTPALEDLDREFGKNLRETRESMKISQRELVDVLNGITGIGWHQTTLAKTEKGERPIRLAEAVLLARVLPISLSALLPSPYAPADQTAIRVHELQMMEETIRRRREQLEGKGN